MGSSADQIWLLIGWAAVLSTMAPACTQQPCHCCVPTSSDLFRRVIDTVPFKKLNGFKGPKDCELSYCLHLMRNELFALISRSLSVILIHRNPCPLYRSPWVPAHYIDSQEPLPVILIPQQSLPVMLILGVSAHYTDPHGSPWVPAHYIDSQEPLPVILIPQQSLPVMLIPGVSAHYTDLQESLPIILTLQESLSVHSSLRVYNICLQYRFFKSSKQSYQHTLSGVDGRGPYFSPCRSADCCGVKLDPAHEPTWLECDDETVRTLTRKQLEEILAPKSVKNSALTPYLLFYCRIP
ncbi:universal stress protein [Homalodisca vitripennis]|nr:universal stress protein [Homalodisca vitripennis]